MNIKSGQIVLSITSLYQLMLLANDKTKSRQGSTGFYINDKLSYVKCNDLHISLDNNLQSTLMEVNLPRKIISSVIGFVNTLIC